MKNILMLLGLLIPIASCATDDDLQLSEMEGELCAPWVCSGPNNTECEYVGCPIPGQTEPNDPTPVEACEFACGQASQYGRSYFQCIAECGFNGDPWRGPHGGAGPHAPPADPWGVRVPGIGPFRPRGGCWTYAMIQQGGPLGAVHVDTLANQYLGVRDLCANAQRPGLFSQCHCIGKVLANTIQRCFDPIAGEFDVLLPAVVYTSKPCDAWPTQSVVGAPPPPPAPPGPPPGGGLDPCNNCPAPQSEPISSSADGIGLLEASGCWLLPEPFRSICHEQYGWSPPPGSYPGGLRGGVPGPSPMPSPP